MSEVRITRWFQHAMLLGALGAGALATQLVPAYREHVGKVTYPSRAAASRSDAPSETSSGYSQTEGQTPRITLARNLK